MASRQIPGRTFAVQQGGSTQTLLLRQLLISGTVTRRRTYAHFGAFTKPAAHGISSGGDWEAPAPATRARRPLMDSLWVIGVEARRYMSPEEARGQDPLLCVHLAGGGGTGGTGVNCVSITAAAFAMQNEEVPPAVSEAIQQVECQAACDAYE